MCATHGACFRIADGHCVAGPCVGESLRSISTVVRDGEAMLDKDKGRGDQS
jgi:nitrite reductase/ring-hydroxylating ferredoxin subunit